MTDKNIILIADDNLENVEILFTFLEQYDLKLFSAENGREVLQHIDNGIKPNLILLDVMMPDMDGFETCRRLKQRENSCDIPVIFMSALSDTNDKLTGFEAGAVDYVIKPFHLREVLARINAQLKIQQLQQELNETVLRQSKEQMDALRSNITRTMPHEFRTPLNGILGFSELILQTYEDMSKDEIVESVRSIYRSGERLHHLIINYLMYAQIEVLSTDTKKIAAFREQRTENVTNTIKKICANIADQYKRSEDLVEQLTPFTGELLISKEYFCKSMEEIVDNAFKFSDKGPVIIHSKLQADFFIIEVIDHGRGIVEEQRMNIGAYMQFDRKIYEQQGAGLGLILVKRLIDLHQGEINIESTLGKGTKIVIKIPAIST